MHVSGGLLRNQALPILEEAGSKYGLVEYLSCGDGTLTEALRTNKRFIAQELGSASEDVQTARTYIRSRSTCEPAVTASIVGTAFLIGLI
jgi:hypothetical protein